MPSLNYSEKLLELMEQFYILTGIRIVLFDENGLEIMAYPKKSTPFCEHMRKDKDFNLKCLESDRCSFRQCMKTKSLTVYKCHAGLIEAAAPLTSNGIIIGYVMFGQVRDIKDKKEFLNFIKNSCGNDLTALTHAEKIKYKSEKQIIATSKILEACVSYILLNDMVYTSKDRLIYKIDEFISSHINEDLSPYKISGKFNISRTQLYEIVKQYSGLGVSEFVRKKRLEKARELLWKTDLPIGKIVEKIGYNDYNYFLKSYQKEYGITPKNFRKQKSNTGL